ncbi:MAG: hypothetical protein M0R73_01685 [Dehalococcoidia bacterium]|nr:hypothetical protein [Dehalococcoidia bacterium]
MRERNRGVMGVLYTVVDTGAVLARVALVVFLAMTLFLVAFLGYFVIPFIFVLLAMGILGLSGTLREYAGLQSRRRK